MKFRHAYYTWDWQQLTQYQGLGIHASSCLDQSFLNQCMSVGSSLKPEGRKKTGAVKDTAHLLLYTEELGYVGAFVSPREDVSGKNRVNMLCHIFAALEKPETICLEDYLVDYAYHTEIKSDRSLQTVEYVYQDKKKSEKYSDLIEKYGFHPKKMAVFLWRFYQTLFEMKSGMTIVIDRDRQPDEEQDRQIAKEITWLLSCLYPKDEFEKHRWYKKLTYGVYTKENIEVVNLHYTDDKTKDNSFNLYGDYETVTGEISPVFLKMGELACEGLCEEGNAPYDRLQNFLNELREDGSAESLRYITMDISYEKWKLEHIEDYVMEEEHLRGMLKELMRGSKNSVWYKELFYQAVKRTDIQDKKMLRQLWNSIIMPQLSAYEGMEEKNEFHEVSYELLNKMHGVSGTDYEAALKALPEEARQDVLERFMGTKPEIILEELEQISDREQLKKCLDKYGTLCRLEYPDVVDLVLDTAWELYEEGSREERHNLSELMLREAKITALDEGWKQCLEDWLEGLDQDIKEFLNFVQEQGKKFERRIVNRIYDIFVSYSSAGVEDKDGFESLWGAEKTFAETEDKDGFESLWGAEEKFRSVYKAEIPAAKIQSFEQAKEKQRIKCKVNRIKKMQLSELLKEPLDDVPNEKCYHYWFVRANELLYQKTTFGGEVYTELSEEQFHDILAYRKTGWKLLQENTTANNIWKRYEEKWTEFDQIMRRNLKNSTFSRRFFYYTSEPYNGAKLWSEIKLSDYRELYELCVTYPESGRILNQSQDKTNGKKDYMIWRIVYQGRTILGKMEQTHVDRNEHGMEYFNALEQAVLEKDDINANDLTNLCIVLYFKFYYPHKKIESGIKRERQYKEVLENKALNTVLGRVGDLKTANDQLMRPYNDVLTELRAVRYSADVLRREDSTFSDWVEAFRKMKRIFGKEETDSMFELTDRIKKTLEDEKVSLENCLKEMRETMTSYEGLLNEKKELIRKLEECESAMKKLKTHAEKEKAEVRSQKEQYISDSNIAGIRADQNLVSDVNQDLRKLNGMLNEVVNYVPVQDEKAAEAKDEQRKEEVRGPEVPQNEKAEGESDSLRSAKESGGPVSVKEHTEEQEEDQPFKIGNADQKDTYFDRNVDLDEFM